MHEFYTYDISIIFVNLVKITGKKSRSAVKTCAVRRNCRKIICTVATKGLKYRSRRYTCSFVYLNLLHTIQGIHITLYNIILFDFIKKKLQREIRNKIKMK